MDWFDNFCCCSSNFCPQLFFQPYIIPTGSLEKSLLLGIFCLLVNSIMDKFSTTIAFPMVHDTLPLIKIRSHLKKPQLPYIRLPRFQKLKETILLFNWPADTVRRFCQRSRVKKPTDKKSNYVKMCWFTRR